MSFFTTIGGYIHVVERIECIVRIVDILCSEGTGSSGRESWKFCWQAVRVKERHIQVSFALFVVNITTTIPDIDAVDGCDAGANTITIIIVAGSVCSVSHTTVGVTSRDAIVVTITTE